MLACLPVLIPYFVCVSQLERYFRRPRSVPYLQRVEEKTIYVLVCMVGTASL